MPSGVFTQDARDTVWVYDRGNCKPNQRRYGSWTNFLSIMSTAAQTRRLLFNTNQRPVEPCAPLTLTRGSRPLTNRSPRLPIRFKRTPQKQWGLYHPTRLLERRQSYVLVYYVVPNAKGFYHGT
jgi:hypothetical protein